MAFTVYLDDSGTDPNQPAANATALIIPASKTIAMEEEFEDLKKKEGFTNFHTSVFVFRNAKSDFANWSNSKQKRVFRRMRQITRRYVTQIFSFSVNKSDYESVVPEKLRHHMGRSHYAWALRHVIPLVQHWRIADPDLAPFDWIFDWMEPTDPARKEVEAVMEQSEQQAQSVRNVEGDYKNVYFRDRKSSAGLQFADLVAWTDYQFSLNIFRRKRMHPFAQKAWQDFQSMPGQNHPSFPGRPLDWNAAVTIQRAHLKDWAEKEVADGTSLRLFEEWEERKKLKKPQKKGK